MLHRYRLQRAQIGNTDVKKVLQLLIDVHVALLEVHLLEYFQPLSQDDFLEGLCSLAVRGRKCDAATAWLERDESDVT